MKWLQRFALGLGVLVIVAGAAAWMSPYRGWVVNQWGRLIDAPPVNAALVKSRLTVPAGYGITLFAKDVLDARVLRVTSAGDLLVASPSRGAVLWFAHDANGDGTADERRVLLEGLDGPNGLDLHGGYLYVAEQGQVGRVRFDDAAGRIDGAYDVVIKDLPRGGNHWKKTIRFGPDGYLYLAIGSSCNVCSEEDERRAAMLRYTADGAFVDIFATGLRNSAGFAWRDADGGLYATDNGRDLLGDDFPPDELNRLEQGGFYGWPYANGDRVADPDLGAGREAVIAASIPPRFAFRAHNAPLGIVFLRSDRHPAAYRGAALVALHGSWNRSQRDGYKVVSLHWDADGAIHADDFMTGFLRDSTVSGRPAELAEDANGAVYVSDDYANVVYKITPGGTTSVEIGAQARTLRHETTASAPADPQLIVRGATLFGQMECQGCHLLSGTSADGRVALDGVAAKYDHASLNDYLANPKAPMPPVEAAETRAALAAFLLDRPAPASNSQIANQIQ